MRRVPGISALLGSLKEVKRNVLIPEITNGKSPSDEELRLLELKPRMGRLGTTSPKEEVQT